MQGLSIVLDNVVLSGFHTAGWFDNLEFWSGSYSLTVPEKVWEEEFLPSRDIKPAPEWLKIVPIEEGITVERPGALSDYDWRCLILAERKNSVLVTRDQALKNIAEERDVETEWCAKFLKNTFEGCGISVPQYDSGLNQYLDDAYLPDRVEQVLKTAEKDD